jgi:hypothetical protein
MRGDYFRDQVDGLPVALLNHAQAVHFFVFNNSGRVVELKLLHYAALSPIPDHLLLYVEDGLQVIDAVQAVRIAVSQTQDALVLLHSRLKIFVACYLQIIHGPLIWLWVQNVYVLSFALAA